MPEHQDEPVPLCSTHLWGRQCHLSATPTLLSAFKWPPVLGKVLSGGLHRQRCIKRPAKGRAGTFILEQNHSGVFMKKMLRSC